MQLFAALDRRDVAEELVHIGSKRSIAFIAPFGFLLCFAATVFAPITHAQSREPSTSPSPGIVFLFSGLVWPLFDSTAGSGSEAIMQRIEARGVRAQLNDPAHWEKAANDFVAIGSRSMPIAVVGYSLGTNAALLFTRWLETQDIPVQTLVLIEASNPQPIMSNVRRAVHYYVSALSDPIQPGRGFTGSLANVDLAKVDPTAATLKPLVDKPLQQTA